MRVDGDSVELQQNILYCEEGEERVDQHAGVIVSELCRPLESSETHKLTCRQNEGQLEIHRCGEFPVSASGEVLFW